MHAGPGEGAKAQAKRDIKKDGVFWGLFFLKGRGVKSREGEREEGTKWHLEVKEWRAKRHGP